MNAAARLVCDLKPRDHVTSSLRTLHWLPVKQRIKFKVCLLVHLAVNGRAPSYLQDLIKPSATCLAEHRSALPAIMTSSYSHPVSNLAIAPSQSPGHARGTACQPNLKSSRTLRCLNVNLKHIYLQPHINNVKLQTVSFSH